MIPGDKSYYSGSDVLINKFDIRDGEKLRKTEYRFVAIRETQARLQQVAGNFDLAHLQSIHKQLFQDVYDWAGQLREIDFAKRSNETGLVSRFMPAVVIDLKAEDLNKFISDRNQLQGLNKVEFVKAITEVHTMMNELHPFREGNGRTARVFLAQLATQAGFDLDLTQIDKARWNFASHQAMQKHDPKNESAPTIPGNQTEMLKIFQEAIKPTLAHAFVTENRAEAVKQHPGLEQAYARLDAITQFVSTLPGRDVKQLMDTERARVVAKLKEGVIPPLNPYLQGRFASRETARAMTFAAAAGASASKQAVPKQSRALRL
jgi:cell filamentation protein